MPVIGGTAVEVSDGKSVMVVSEAVVIAASAAFTCHLGDI